MRIGIDVSQTSYEGTGVANFVENLVVNLIKQDKVNEYVLFFSSLRKNLKSRISDLKYTSKNLKLKTYRLPPIVLDLLWNRLHIFPIEWFIGNVDVFISSDWTEPPTIKAKKITFLYDLIVYKHPKETAKMIVEVQKRKHAWSKQECDKIICISRATKKDAIEILNIPEEKLVIVYPGV